MSNWQDSFAKKIGTLRQQWAQQFDTLASDVLLPVFEHVSEFVAQWEFVGSAPRVEGPMQAFKFALDEEAYVLVFFRGRGVDGVQCQWECSVPGHGMVKGPVTEEILRNASRKWVEAQFQAALDAFVDKLGDAERARGKAEPALV